MKKSSLLAMCIVGMGISGAVLILMIPPLFSANGQNNTWFMAALGLLFLVFAAGARYWKRSVDTLGDDR